MHYDVAASSAHGMDAWAPEGFILWWCMHACTICMYVSRVRHVQPAKQLIHLFA